jgi:hypothetical protein
MRDRPADEPRNAKLIVFCHRQFSARDIDRIGGPI